MTGGDVTAAAVGRLQAQYRAGDYAGVVVSAARFPSGSPEFAAAMQLSGQANVRLGNDEIAAIHFLQAALHPSVRRSVLQSLSLFNAARSMQRLGHLASAKFLLCCDLLLAPLRGVQRSSPLLLVGLLHEAPAAQQAVLALASAIPELRVECIERLLRLLRMSSLPSAQSSMNLDIASDGDLLSVIICSHRDALFARCAAECDRAFVGQRFELIRIADARSMCEGYQRGFDASKGELLVFMHDDVELLSPDFGVRLRRELGHCDLLAIAGATRFHGPAWFSSGVDYLRGSVTVPRSDGGYELHWASLGVERTPLAVADGFFLACRRRVASAIRWDAFPIPGFHGYDIDFTHRAWRAGFQVQSAVSLQVAHASEGVFDDRWLDASKAVCARLGVELGPGTSPRWLSLTAESREEATMHFDRVLTCVASAPSTVRRLLDEPGALNAAASQHFREEFERLLPSLIAAVGAVSSGSTVARR